MNGEVICITPPKRRDPKNEAWVKTKVKKILTDHRVWFYMPSAAIYGRSGASDFILCINGRMCVAEAKQDSTSNVTKLQRAFMEQVVRAGGAAFVVHRANLPEFEAWIVALSVRAA